MSRPSKGPSLKVNERGMYIIRDGQTNRGTGCYARKGPAAQKKAEEKLLSYIREKHNPAQAIDKSRPNEAKIADILSLEMDHVAEKENLPEHRRNELITVYENMAEWFGTRCVGDLNGKLQKRYAAERMKRAFKLVDGKRQSVPTDRHAPIAAWRDLKLLSAAVNRYLATEIGGITSSFSAVLPEGPEPRERYLTRSEAAKMIMTAWRMRRESGIPGKPGRHTHRHIARYILVGVYTGSRNGDICGAAVIPTIGRGYVDLERGIFKRKPDNKKETSKKQPTIPLPSQLLAHMRRWKRLGISNHSVIEFNSRPITRVRDGWDTLVERAGLASEDPKQKIVRHTLRHTAITWYLEPHHRTGESIDIELVSQYCGVSVATIRKTYRHSMQGTFKPLLAASRGFGKQSGEH